MRLYRCSVPRWNGNRPIPARSSVQGIVRSSSGGIVQPLPRFRQECGWRAGDPALPRFAVTRIRRAVPRFAAMRIRRALRHYAHSLCTPPVCRYARFFAMCLPARHFALPRFAVTRIRRALRRHAHSLCASPVRRYARFFAMCLPARRFALPGSRRHFSMVALTASMKAWRMPLASSASTPRMVVPRGEQTPSLIAAGIMPVSSCILPVPSAVWAARR